MQKLSLLDNFKAIQILFQIIQISIIIFFCIFYQIDNKQKIVIILYSSFFRYVFLNMQISFNLSFITILKFIVYLTQQSIHYFLLNFLQFNFNCHLPIFVEIKIYALLNI
ncbi:transmembrane protein, putative (macronuclear) [Tetrahymena thermophila SB210]|uniref:Transmembrane protein, putative n=1 Tax=Tetrahymena thermophila (strain SB210) TaxID=312017 RepID=X1W3P1_TETTS|nr:transmembrane protein, putative [Tetrahymena thermophila SB210]EDK31218.1 transmembrane protein, putative [Tetrahymena thermophila SB210]|eukprot:XP_001470656.1 transmembrane protein, putative [Tetrahymena thermophila SB210]